MLERWRRARRIQELAERVRRDQRAAAEAIRRGHPDLAAAYEDSAEQAGRLLDLEHGTTPKRWRRP